MRCDFDSNIDNKLYEYRKKNRWYDIISILEPLAIRGQFVWDRGWYISQLGFAYSQVKKLDKALYCYKRWLELEGKKSQPYYCIGYVWYIQNKWVEALEWFDQALEIEPEYLVCLYRKGVALQRQFKYKQSHEVLYKAVKIYLASGDEDYQKRNKKYFYRSIFYLGKAFFGIHDYKNAKACFNKVLTEEKFGYIEQVYKVYNLAKSHLALGEYELSLKAINTILKYAKDNVWIYDLKGRIYYCTNEFNHALDTFSKALKIRKFSYIHQGRAKTWIELNKPDRAIADFEQALKRDRKGKHKILLQLGEVYLNRDQYTIAINYFKRAIEFKMKVWDADYAEAHLALATAYRFLGNKEAATQETSIAYEIKPHLEWEDSIISVLQDEEVFM